MSPVRIFLCPQLRFAIEDLAKHHLFHLRLHILLVFKKNSSCVDLLIVNINIFFYKTIFIFLCYKQLNFKRFFHAYIYDLKYLSENIDLKELAWCHFGIIIDSMVPLWHHLAANLKETNNETSQTTRYDH